MPGVKVTNRTEGQVGQTRRARCARSAFTLVDILVSLTVIAVLIGLLLPSLAGVRELTRRVVCASNTRQHGLGFAMYVEDSKGEMPASKFDAKRSAAGKGELQNMMIARTNDTPAIWDGLGILYHAEYLNAPQVFYCPSHIGEHPYSKYAGSWPNDFGGQLVINYQYRGSPTAQPGAQPDRLALITDGLRTKFDFNHQVGANVLRADYSLKWFADPSKSISQALPTLEGELTASDKVEDAWMTIDGGLDFEPAGH